MDLFLRHMKHAKERMYAKGIKEDITTAARSIAEIYNDYAEEEERVIIDHYKDEEEVRAIVRASDSANGQRTKAAKVLGLNTTNPSRKQLKAAQRAFLLGNHPDKAPGHHFVVNYKELTESMRVFDDSFRLAFGT